MHRDSTSHTRRTTRLALAVGLLGSLGSALAAPTISLSRISLDAARQNVVLTYSADLGFPLGRRYAQTTLDCKTNTVTTRGYVDERSSYRMPEQFKEDQEGAAGLLKAKIVNVGAAALSYNDSGLTPRWFCRSGVVVTDLSSLAARPGVSLKGSYTEGNLQFINDGSFMPVRLDLPSFIFRREDDVLATAIVTLQFRGRSLASADALVGASINAAPFDRPREALFLLEKDGKALRPLAYGRQVPGLKTVVPVKAGKNGTVLTLYYTEDYTSNDWQRLTVDLAAYQVWTVKVGKPAGIRIGQ